MSFQIPLDIVNRALGHCGRKRIYSFADPSAQAAELSFVYDKCRDAELSRNVWAFAIRRAVLRPIDTATVIWSPPTWVATTSYAAGAVISYTPVGLNASELGANPLSYLWYTDLAITGSVANPTPDVATAWHRYFGPVTADPYVATSYWTGELTLVGGTTLYSSLISNNTDLPPTANWLQQGGTFAPLNILYPIGTGPANNTRTANAYRLPYGFLRKAPQDPRGDFGVWLGAPSGLMDTDWVYENGYLVSRDGQPLLIRFIADIIDVYEMSPMFCEGLAARIATEIAPSLVEKDILSVTLANTARHYRGEMVEARMANAVLIGSEAPPLDSYISCRL
jgi:hypothetical protein